MSREPKAKQVACCAIFDAILSAQRPAALAAPPSPLPVERLQLLLPRCGLFDEVDPVVSAAFEAATAKLREAGATVVHVDAPVLDRAQAKLFANGGFAAAEAWHAHRELLATSQARLGLGLGLGLG